MPHSSKKYRKKPDQQSPVRSRTTLIIVAVVIIAIIALGGGYYVYSTMKSTTSTTTTSGAYRVTTVSVNSQTQVTMNETLVNSTTYVVYAKMHIGGAVQGDIELELFPQSAPRGVANFVNLARTGFYNNILFHRIIAGFVIQAGDPTTKVSGGVPGGTPSSWGQDNGPVGLPTEIDSKLHNSVGTIALAHSSSPNSSGSQFYINLANNSNLDGSYTVFGKVISGMSVVTAISQVTPVETSSNSTPGQGTPLGSSAYVYITGVDITNSP